MQTKLGLITVASPLEVGADKAGYVLSALAERLAEGAWDGLEVLPFKTPLLDPEKAREAGEYFRREGVAAVCCAATSWFEDYLVLDMLEEWGCPLILWALPGMETGSLCGMQQLAYMLKVLEVPLCFIFDEIASQDALNKALAYAKTASVRQKLRRAKIGYLGHRVEGMTETTASELALKKVFGVRVVGIDMDVFLKKVEEVPPESVQDAWEELKRSVGKVSCKDDAGIYALRVYEAFRDIITQRNLDAVAAGCYPNLMGRVCLAASLLADEGIPLACEGDVNGALGMLILTALSGKPTHNTDFLDPIPSANTIVFSHCGSGSFSLADGGKKSVELAPVRLMDEGVCCLFTPAPGPTTLINIVPTSQGYKIGMLYGDAVKTDMVFPGNPLRVRFSSPYKQIIQWIVDEGLGHHWMAVQCDVRDMIRDLCNMLNCPLTAME